jgi:TolB-like protein
MNADLRLTPIDLAHEAAFALGAVEVRPAIREVVSGERRETLEPRIMQVLVALARQRGEMVSRDDLIQSCWGGRIVGEDSISRCISGLRRLAEQVGGFSVETVTRVGYRLNGAADPIEGSESLTLAPASKPSIAVMPFANLSGDPEQEYFVDGMVVEIITALSRFPSLFVIASGSTLTYRGAQAGRQRIARELGVRYLLEGSVRKVGERVRIAVQLIEANDDAQLWAERYDGTLEDVFALQDTVANAVASQIEPTIQVAEIRRANARPTKDLDAYDLYLRALPFLQRYDKDALNHGLDLLDQAITRDPEYALALAWAATFRGVRQVLGWSNNPDEDRRIALDHRARALRLAPDDPDVLPHVALAARWAGMDGAVAEAGAERALARNPGSAYAWLAIGFVHRYGGKPDAALTAFETSLRLDPRSAWRPIILDGMCGALFSLRRFDEVIALYRQLWDLLPGLTPQYAPCIASALAHAGRLVEAREMAKDASIEPLAAWLDTVPPTDRELVLSGFALAQGRD